MALSKRVRIFLAVILFAAQCGVWAYTVFTHWETRNAEIIYLPVRLYDPLDYFRGAYLDLRMDVPIYQGSESMPYIVFHTDTANRVAGVSYFNDVPKDTSVYAENFTLRRFYTSEERAAELEGQFFTGDYTMIIEMGVRQGRYSIIDLHLE